MNILELSFPKRSSSNRLWSCFCRLGFLAKGICRCVWAFGERHTSGLLGLTWMGGRGAGNRSSPSYFLLSIQKRLRGLVWSTFLGSSCLYLSWVRPQGGVNLLDGLGRFQDMFFSPHSKAGTCRGSWWWPSFLKINISYPWWFQGHTSVNKLIFIFHSVFLSWLGE